MLLSAREQLRVDVYVDRIKVCSEISSQKHERRSVWFLDDIWFSETNMIISTLTWTYHLTYASKSQWSCSLQTCRWCSGDYEGMGQIEIEIYKAWMFYAQKKTWLSTPRFRLFTHQFIIQPNRSEAASSGYLGKKLATLVILWSHVGKEGQRRSLP